MDNENILKKAVAGNLKGISRMSREKSKEMLGDIKEAMTETGEPQGEEEKNQRRIEVNHLIQQEIDKILGGVTKGFRAKKIARTDSEKKKIKARRDKKKRARKNKRKK